MIFLTGYKIIKDRKVVKLIFRYPSEATSSWPAGSMKQHYMEMLNPYLLVNLYFKAEPWLLIPAHRLSRSPVETSHLESCFAKKDYSKKMKVNTSPQYGKRNENSDRSQETNGQGELIGLCGFNIDFLE